MVPVSYPSSIALEKKETFTFQSTCIIIDLFLRVPNLFLLYYTENLYYPVPRPGGHQAAGRGALGEHGSGSASPAARCQTSSYINSSPLTIVRSKWSWNASVCFVRTCSCQHALSKHALLIPFQFLISSFVFFINTWTFTYIHGRTNIRHPHSPWLLSMVRRY